MDLNRFEEIFRLGRVAVGDDEVDGGTPRMERRFSRRPETVSLLEPNRLRNVGKYVICPSIEVKTKGEVSTSLYQNLFHKRFQGTSDLIYLSIYIALF